jgi:hypothetical protein
MRYSSAFVAAGFRKKPERRRRKPSSDASSFALASLSCSSRFVSDAERLKSALAYASKRPSRRHSSENPTPRVAGGWGGAG